jgi:Fe-S protein assembly co-chaperone HscB
MDIDLVRLEEIYMGLARKMHPDRMVTQKRAVQTRALVLTSALNDSYRALVDERQRAEHLLKLAGGPTADAHKAAPQAFLLEMMDLHEEVEQAKDAGDVGRLEGMGAGVVESYAGCMARVRGLLSSSSPNLVEVREQLNVAKYWNTLRAEIDAARKAS